MGSGAQDAREPRGPDGAANEGRFPPAVWVGLYAAFWAVQVVIWAIGYHYAGTFPRPVFTTFYDAVGWFGIGTASLFVGYVLPWGRGFRTRALTIVGGALVISTLRVVFLVNTTSLLGIAPLPFVQELLVNLPGNLLVITSYVALGSGVAGVVRNRREQARLAQLDAELGDTRLNALRSHLRPDFVLQAMASIADQIEAGAPGAGERLDRLGYLLRLQLNRARRRRVTVDEEIEFMQVYLDLDRAGPGAGMRLEVDADDAARGCLVPPNCLSILLEFVLGARRGHAGEAVVRMEARVAGGELVASVSDDLPVPLETRLAMERGVLAELSELLRMELGPAYVPELYDREPGVTARLRLPVEV